MARQTLVKCPKCGEIKIPNGSEWFRHCGGNWMIADHIYQDVRPDFKKKEKDADVRLPDHSEKPDRVSPQERVEPSGSGEDRVESGRSDYISQTPERFELKPSGDEAIQEHYASTTSVMPASPPQMEEIQCGNCNNRFQYPQGNYPSTCPVCGVSWE